TEAWWQQFTGKGIVGHYAGGELARIVSEIVAFEDFEAAHPSGLVLSRETGFRRPYGHNPYAGYDRIDQSPFLLNTKADARLPPMERVLSVSVAGGHRLYPLSLLERHPCAYRRGPADCRGDGVPAPSRGPRARVRVARRPLYRR